MSTLFRGIRVCLAAALCVAAVAGMNGLPARAADKETINTLFQMGKAAYYKGELEQALQFLSQVESMDPRHFETRAMLAQIRLNLKSTGDMSLKKRYEGVMLSKIEFSDLTLQEALDGLRVMSKNASEGKVIPNFIVQDPALNTKTLSLNLSGLPLSEAIQYLARVAGCKVVYEKHAVLFTSAGAAAPAG